MPKGIFKQMKTASIASGSKGNCVYIESKLARILIDCGLSLTNTEKRLSSIDVSPDSIDAIFLTHEHVDHLGGVKYFLKKHRNTKIFIPSFVKNYAIKGIMDLPEGQIVWYSSSEFFFKDITVSSFILPHDSKFCVGYTLSFSGKKISYATDLGFVSQDTLDALSKSDILYLESNHDENMLKQNPRYPIATKKRILGPNGHISNLSCAVALVSLVTTGVKQVILCHLSEENNSPEMAYKTVKLFLAQHGIEEGKNVCVDVAFQHKVGTVFEW